MTSLVEVRTIDIARPEVQSSTAGIVEGSTLGAHDSGYSSDERVIESCTHEDRLGEGGGIAEFAGGCEGDTGTASNTVLNGS